MARVVHPYPTSLVNLYTPAEAVQGSPRIVYLKADPGLLRARLAGRAGHFMPLVPLPSHLATLEEPTDA